MQKFSCGCLRIQYLGAPFISFEINADEANIGTSEVISENIIKKNITCYILLKRSFDVRY